jgi:Tol biopolymer transport system component
MRKIAAFCAAVFTLSLLASVLPFPGRQAWAAEGDGKILFTRSVTPSFNEQIYVVDPDGTNETNLSNSATWDWAPTWSPDATKIAFVRQGSNDNIYVMNADGTGATQLTSDAADEDEPSWSPDGSKIAFRSSRDGNHEIYVMNADGSNQTRLTNDSAADRDPEWSPDGTKIVFQSARPAAGETGFRLYTMDADGSNQTQLTSFTGSATHSSPSWSPDGTQIAYTCNYGSGLNVCVADADGTNEVQITNDTSDEIRPSWSPDGTQIAYESSVDSGGQTIYIMDADGSNKTRITQLFPSFEGYSIYSDWGGVDITGGGSGSGSGTGIPDDSQPNVTRLTNPVTGNDILLESSCSSNQSVSAIPEPSDPADAGFSYPFGLVGFTLQCGTNGVTATISVYYYESMPSSSIVLRYYNNSTGAYQTITSSTTAQLTDNGQNVIKLTFQITDGSFFDTDAVANGEVFSFVGLGQSAVGAPNTGLGGRLRNID